MAVSEINQGGGGDFTTIAGFEAAAAYGDVGQITDAGGTVYAETVTWSGASGTGSDSNRIRLEATNEHLGVPGAGIIQRSTAGHVNTINEAWLHFLGFEVQQNGSGSSDEGFRTSDANTVFERLIVNASGNVSDQDGIYFDAVNSDGAVVVNCIIYGFRRAGIHNPGGNIEVHFVTSDENGVSGETFTGAFRQDGASADAVIYNSSFTRNGDPEGDINIDGGVVSGSNNASSDTTVTGESLGTLDNLNVVTAFTDADARDYSLATGSALEAAGVDRTGSPPSVAVDLTVDIAGTTRPATPSIGAFDVAAAGGATLTAEQGSYSLSGQTSDLLRGLLLDAAQGSYSIAGQDATLARGLKLTAAAGTYSVSGQAAALLRGLLLTAEQGAYALNGQDATLARGLLLAADQGSYTVTGLDATLVAGIRLIAEQGGYSLTGLDAALLWARVLDANQGSYTVSGQDATLARGVTLTAEQGTYTLTGLAADLLRGLLLTAERGTYTLSGEDAALLRGLLLSADQGAYTLTGNDAALLRGLRLAAEQGGYTLSGQDAELLRGLVLAAEQGAYVVTGNAAALSKSGEVILLAEQGNYAVTGQPATLIAPTEEGAVFEGPHLVNVSRLMRSH